MSLALLKSTISAAHAPRVSVLSLHGVIAAGADRFRRGLNLSAMEKAVATAFSLSGVRMVALLINSPGGSPVQSRLLHDRIRAHAAESKIPVIAFAEDVAASGGYMLALAADEIYASSSSIVGSIGVISAGFGFPGLLRKLGVERRVYAAGDNKSTLDPFKPENPEDIDRLKAIQRDVHDEFIDLVRTRRKGRLNGDDADLFSGAFWSGRQAVSLGLVDGVADMRTLLRDRFGEKVRLKAVGESGRGPFGRFFAGAQSVDPLAKSVAASMEVLDQRAAWARYGL